MVEDDSWTLRSPNATVLFVDIAIKIEKRFIREDNFLRKIVIHLLLHLLALNVGLIEFYGHTNANH